MSRSLKYLRDLTERLLSCESPSPCIDLTRVAKGLRCSKDMIKKRAASDSSASSSSDIIDDSIDEDQLGG